MSSLNTIKAILLINAKKAASKKGLGKTKGWTDEARAKAALTRKAKKKVAESKAPKKKSKGIPESIVKKTMAAKKAGRARMEAKKSEPLTQYSNESANDFKVRKHIHDTSIQRETERKAAIDSVKKLLPSGTSSSGSWRKSGGYSGQKSLSSTVKKLKAAGFEHSNSTSHGSPDGNVVGSGSHYVHPKTGVRVTMHETYGVTSRENSYSLSVHAPETKSSKILKAYSDLDKHSSTIKYRKWDKESEKLWSPERKATDRMKQKGSESRKYVASKLRDARKGIHSARATLKELSTNKAGVRKADQLLLTVNNLLGGI